MKNKKSLLGLVLLLLVAILGVGYAVVNNTQLKITGEASVKTEELDVHFTNATSGNADKVTATVTSNTKEATINVKDMVLNETLTATYTIKNEETDVTATLKTPVVNVGNSTYFSATAELAKNTLGPGEETTITVTVKSIKTPVAETDSKTSITVTIDAEPAAA